MEGGNIGVCGFGCSSCGDGALTLSFSLDAICSYYRAFFVAKKCVLSFPNPDRIASLPLPAPKFFFQLFLNCLKIRLVNQVFQLIGIRFEVIKLIQLSTYDHQLIGAFARTLEKLTVEHHQVLIVKGDVRDPEAVSRAVRGADAVISAIGPTSGSPPDPMKTAAEQIVSAMQTRDVSRLIWPTGAGVPAPESEPTLMNKAISFLLKLISGKVLENSIRGAEMIRDSDLEWTIARAPMLTDQPGSGRYQATYVNSQMGRTLSRENYTVFMLELTESEDWVREMPAVSDA